MLRIRLNVNKLKTSIQRCYSSSKSPKDQQSIRNIGILAHIDAGRTLFNLVHSKHHMLINCRFVFKAKLQRRNECCIIQAKQQV